MLDGCDCSVGNNSLGNDSPIAEGQRYTVDSGLFTSPGKTVRVPFLLEEGGWCSAEGSSRRSEYPKRRLARF